MSNKTTTKSIQKIIPFPRIKPEFLVLDHRENPDGSRTFWLETDDADMPGIVAQSRDYAKILQVADEILAKGNARLFDLYASGRLCE